MKNVNNLKIHGDNSGKALEVIANDSMKLPSGTTAQRPGTPEAGMFRYNATDKTVEFYEGSAWQQVSDNPVIGAENGINLNGTTKKVELGGNLTKDTIIGQLDSGHYLQTRSASVDIGAENSADLQITDGTAFVHLEQNLGQVQATDIEIAGDFDSGGISIQASNVLLESTGNLLRITGNLNDGTINGGVPATDVISIVGQNASKDFREIPLSTFSRKNSQTASLVVGSNTITHNLNLASGAERDIVIQAIEIATGDAIVIDTFTAFTADSFTFTSAVAIANVRITVIG